VITSNGTSVPTQDHCLNNKSATILPNLKQNNGLLHLLRASSVNGRLLDTTVYQTTCKHYNNNS
jgi:hypothetical protein